MIGALASYRVRLPLGLSSVAVLTAVLMALALGLQTLHNLGEDQARNARRLAHAMSAVLVEALRHDDVWLAYSLLRGLEGPDGPDAEIVWVLVDVSGRIFASNLPRRYRLDTRVDAALPWLEAGATTGTPPAAVSGSQFLPGGDSASRLLRIPLTSDGTQVGELVALLSNTPYLVRFREILRGGLAVTVAALALVLPLGWLWGLRLVAPLTRLADCIARVGRDDPRALHCPRLDGSDEIGQLGRRFTEMLDALAEKAALEERMLATERLAAVGRVAAGVAHEINNPLGGMIMAIDTYRTRPGATDPETARLLDLLDRALQQIQATVSALLVEARPDGRTLTPADIDDVRTLVKPRLTRDGTSLGWHTAWTGDSPAATGLPAAPVRQLLLNLVLNAVAAAGRDGAVQVRVAAADGELRLDIENRGRPLPAEQLHHAFEPYPMPRPGRSGGLGLWMCYQIASQLGGHITLEADGPLTRVGVRLPLRRE
ncbi:HAMP domain-containing histidine kinase [Thiohalocapsa marina]|uniref:histidine kinase n=1 Tax=Thiohalocapsa marina TaxID=424902 RepID=A0A5M8FBZ0_9GAMM|nr:HAMP domain-containing sensor histidine kinase [Thiohalocapsa marina]KAA6182378.1 HAMP domain-containing histidine kinase [Thiohalocapsa marina]